MRPLTPVEARVLGSLMEKSATTPEYYPLSLNALVNACNQRSSREPVMDLSEAEVYQALRDLEDFGAVGQVRDSRVAKFEHRAGEKWNLHRDEFALVCCLLLRGPQTPGELRARTERMHAFGEMEAVHAGLARLAAKQPPMVESLPRQPGAREQRWRELLSEAHGAEVMQVGSAPASIARADVLEELRAEIASLRERVERLEAAR